PAAPPAVAAVASPAPPALRTPVVAPPARASAWSLQGGAFAGVWQVDHPALPRAQLGGSVGFGWELLDVELRGALALPREQSGSDGLRVRSETQSYGVAGCVHLGGRFRVGPCTGVSLLVTDAETRGVSPASSKRALWAALTLGAQASVELVPHLELVGEGGISTALSPRPSFTFGESVTRAVAVGVYGRLGMRFRWALAPGRFRWRREKATR
ncbi:MAG: hypothetical protein JWN04_2276, partial [Myxococcaceae bacterium]|nr:hypothetical protein [Myxococcaceae bacterium]